MSPCLITRRYLSLPRQSPREAMQVSADHYKAPATAIPVPLTDPTTGAGVGMLI